jgi:hypothetical protein
VHRGGEQGFTLAETGHPLGLGVDPLGRPTGAGVQQRNSAFMRMVVGTLRVCDGMDLTGKTILTKHDTATSQARRRTTPRCDSDSGGQGDPGPALHALNSTIQRHVSARQTWR